MDDVKSLFASKTFWCAVVAILAGALAGSDYALAETDRAEVTDLLVAIGAAGGGVGAIVGRMLATARIRRKIDKTRKEKPALFVAILAALLLGGCGSTLPMVEVEKDGASWEVPGGFSAYEWEPAYTADGKFVGFAGRVYTGREVDDLTITTTRDAAGLPTVSLHVAKVSGIEAQQTALAAMAGMFEKLTAMLDKMLAMAASMGAAGLPLPLGLPAGVSAAGSPTFPTPPIKPQ